MEPEIFGPLQGRRICKRSKTRGKEDQEKLVKTVYQSDQGVESQEGKWVLHQGEQDAKKNRTKRRGKKKAKEIFREQYVDSMTQGAGRGNSPACDLKGGGKQGGKGGRGSGVGAFTKNREGKGYRKAKKNMP